MQFILTGTCNILMDTVIPNKPNQPRPSPQPHLWPPSLRYHGPMEISFKQQVLRSIGHQQWLRGRDRILRQNLPRQHDQLHRLDRLLLRRFNFQELLILGELADAFHAQGKTVNFFDVGANIGHHTLKPFKPGNTEEALVLPAELAGIIRDTKHH